MTETICLIHSGDKAEHVWDYWYYYWKKYYTCGYDTIFLSEEKSKNYDGVHFAHTGKVPWGEGLLNYLGKIEVKYVIYMHEDYFLTEPTKKEKMEELIKIVKDNDIQLLKHVGHWAGNPDHWKDGNHFLEKSDIGDNIWMYCNNEPYLISHQTSIWNKDFLLSTLQPQYTPWCHEIEGTTNLRKRNIPLFAYRGGNPFEYCETMQSGKVREGQEKYFEVNLEGE